MNIFVDAMGGDFAPQATVQGSVEAVIEYGISLTLVGNEGIIRSELSQYDYPADAIQILNAETVIGFDEEPVKAIRKKTDSSLVVALNAMKECEDAVLISAGSTGAILTGGMLKLGRIKGIKRPALAVILPKAQGHLILIDTGANADNRAEHLEQFAVLGQAYAQGVMGILSPKIGLINIGTEEEKGSLLTKETYQLLKNNAEINFIGNVESRDIPVTEADVLVCDGYTGNIILKLTEGLVSFLMGGIKQTVMGSLKGKIGGALIKEDLRDFKKQFDSSEIGGAPFLGVNGGVIKAHGNSNAAAFKNAIRQGISFSEGKVNEKIISVLQKTKETSYEKSSLI